MRWSQLSALKPGDVIVHPMGLREVIAAFHYKFSLQWAVCDSSARIYWGRSGSDAQGQDLTMPGLEEWDLELPALDFGGVT